MLCVFEQMISHNKHSNQIIIVVAVWLAPHVCLQCFSYLILLSLLFLVRPVFKPTFKVSGPACGFTKFTIRQNPWKAWERNVDKLYCSQFHQHLLCAFFVWIIGAKPNVTRENDVCTKNSYVKCWWNWHLVTQASFAARTLVRKPSYEAWLRIESALQRPRFKEAVKELMPKISLRRLFCKG